MIFYKGFECLQTLLTTVVSKINAKWMQRNPIFFILFLHKEKRSPDARHGGPGVVFLLLAFGLALAGSFFTLLLFFFVTKQSKNKTFALGSELRSSHSYTNFFSDWARVLRELRQPFEHTLGRIDVVLRGQHPQWHHHHLLGPPLLVYHVPHITCW